jgi:methyl coenzyme M reductase alpha subunit
VRRNSFFTPALPSFIQVSNIATSPGVYAPNRTNTYPAAVSAGTQRATVMNAAHVTAYERARNNNNSATALAVLCPAARTCPVDASIMDSDARLPEFRA